MLNLEETNYDLYRGKKNLYAQLHSDVQNLMPIYVLGNIKGCPMHMWVVCNVTLIFMLSAQLVFIGCGMSDWAW